MRLITKLLFLLIAFYSFTLQAQIEDLLPVLSDPQVVLDSEGNKLFELPAGEHIVNSLDGKPDWGWVQGMAGVDIGTCGNIVTYNYDSGKHYFYDIEGNRVRQFHKKYKSITPCREGYHVAVSDSKKSNYFSVDVYHFLDKKGDVIFAREGYQKADVFVDGLAAVKTKENGWAYINDLGHELKLIPQSISGIRSVTSFHDGVSVINTSIPDNKIRNTFGVYLIDKEGNILFNSQDVFEGNPVKRVSRSHDGIVTMLIYKGEGVQMTDHVVYLDKHGKIIVNNKDSNNGRTSEGGYLWPQTRVSKKKYFNQKIYDKKGVEIPVPKLLDASHHRIHHINDQYFQVSYKTSDGVFRNTIFDAKKGKNIYTFKGDVMGVKGNLISLKESMIKRYYVVDINTQEIVYDTELKDQIVYDLEANEDKEEQIKNFVCKNLKDVEKLRTLTQLHELTICVKDLKELPDLSKLTQLKVLRLDGCRALKEFPVYLNSLTQLSLRDCTSATNLIEMVDAQKNLEKLFIVNFDISDEDKAKITAKYPEATISGKASHADLMIQEDIHGF